MSTAPLATPTRRRGHAALGLFALALFAGAIGATWIFLSGALEGGVPVSAVFSSPGVGQQLPEGGDVKVRGVLVGRISEIRLADDGNAIVEFDLRDEVSLPETTRAEIRSKTIFGQKWVELLPEGSSSPKLVAGSVIPDARTVEPLELERALELGHDLLAAIPLDDLATVTRTLAEGFTGREKDAGIAIDRGLMALRAVNARSAELDLSLRQLRGFSEFLDQRGTDIVSFLASFDQANRALVGAAPELAANLDSVPVFFDEFADFQELTEADLGRLIESGATVAEFLAPRTDDLVSIITRLEPFTTVWNSGLKEPCDGEFETNLTCWQVYLSPGMDSRGIYRDGEAPDANQAGDPYFDRKAGSASSLDLLLQAADPNDLSRLLLTPAVAGAAP